MDTEADPNIMGPAAPMGTSGPWDSQSETMVVRNMAGKTEIIPEMNGKPIDAIHTEAPIAKPAAVPLTNKTPQPTAFFPAGAVVRLHCHESQNNGSRCCRDRNH